MPLNQPEKIKPSSTLSLDGMRKSVAVPSANSGFFRQYLAFAGPGLMVSVGYMDPGNWATDLRAGAEYQYGLLWVVAGASLMAMLLQVISARLGVATGKDLAQCCRDWYPPWTRIPNWLACEVAIGACDLAECLGSAVALKLLFHIPLLWAVIITAFDVLLILTLEKFGMRALEAVVLVLVLTIAGCYFLEVFVLPQTRPDFLALGHGLVVPRLDQPGMLYVTIGIIGATVMPHNLYLHSALVQSRKFQANDESIRQAIRFNTIDSVISLGIAFFINAAILVLAAVVFFGKDSVSLPDGAAVQFSADSDWLQIAYLTLAPLMGTALASTLFAVALLASGQSSTITGTLAGQVVMEGFLNWRLAPWARRLITRVLAVLPAIVLIAWHGDKGVTELLTLSQVILGIQLPLALVPLLQFSSSKRHMGKWANGMFLVICGWAACLVIIIMDLCGLPELFHEIWHVLVVG